MERPDNKVISRIYGKGRGWAFSKIDFQDIASQSTIGSILFRLEKKGTIRRVIRGIYDYPKEGNLTKELFPPDIPNIAQAIARKYSWEIAPSGEVALNLIGLSTQVPAKYIYLNNSKSKKYQINKRQLVFKKTLMKEISFKHSESILIVQSLRALGKDNINDNVIIKLKKYIDSNKKEAILRDTKTVTSWIYEVIKEVCN